MIDPTTGEEQINPLESMIESTILQNEEMKEQGEETNALLGALIAQGENDNDALIQAQIENDNQNTEKLVGAIKELKPELEKSASSTDRMVNFLEQMKGEKGDKGETGDKGDKGDQGEQGIQGVQGEKGDTGEKGEKGDTGKEGKKGRDGLDGSDGKDGKDGKKGKDGSPDTGEEIVTKLSKLKGEKRLDKSAIKGLDKMQKEIDHVSSFGSSGQEYRIAGTKVSANSQTLNFIAGSNTTITGAATSDGANITITATGGGGGAVDSVNGQTGVVVLDQDDIGDGTTYKQYSATEKTKLAGIEDGAEVNTIDTVSDTTEIDLAITARDLTATIRSGSIDESKLDTSVNASLDLADTAVQPAGLSGYELLANKATDFSTVNNTLYPTVQAVNTAINTAVTGLLDYRGSYDASTNLFPATGGSGILGAVLSGDFWICSVAGTLGGTPVTLGDLIIAIVDTPGQTAGNWDLIENTLGYTPENVANKENTTIDTNTTKYPTVNLLKTGLDTKQATLVSGTNIKTVNSTTLLGSGDIAVATTAQGALADSALQPADIASGTITARADDINFSGGSDGDVLTVQADGSLALETPGGGSGTVTSVTSANGDATVANTTTTPVITIVSAPKFTTARTIGTATGDVTSAGSSFDGTGNNTNALTIANSAVTLAKMADLAQDQFIGRTSASTGVPQTTTITAAARTVLDDTTVADMVNTLGGATSTGTGGLVRAGSPALVTPSIAAITVSGGILTLPTGASDTLVSKNSTDTLTNKSISLGTNTLTTTVAQLNTAITDGNIIPEAGGTFTGDISVPDEAYGSGWNGSVEVPTKNAIYDKIETLGGGAYQLVSYTTTTGGTEHTVSSLDLATDLRYKILVETTPNSTGASAGVVYLRINGITTASSYWQGRRMSGIDAGGGAATDNDTGSKGSRWDITTNSVNGSMIEIDLSLVKSNRANSVRPTIRWNVTTSGENSVDTFFQGDGGGFQNTQTNVTSFIVGHGGAGTPRDFKVWVLKPKTA